MKIEKKKRVRMSMKLLWKLAYDFRDAHKEKDTGMIAVFLLEVDRQMKPLKP